MIASGHAAEEAGLATIDDGSDLSVDPAFGPNGAHGFRCLSQTGDGVDAGHQNSLRCGQERNRPDVGRDRQIDDDICIVMGHAFEQRRQDFDARIADVQAIARRREDVHAARMGAGEGLEELVVESTGLVDDFPNLEFRRDVQIVADVAGLEVEVDDGNFAVLRRLAPDKLDGRFDRQRRIADAPGAGQE